MIEDKLDKIAQADEIKTIGQIMDIIGFRRERFTTEDNYRALDGALSRCETMYFKDMMNTYGKINYYTTYKLFDLVANNIRDENKHEEFFNKYIDTEDNKMKIQSIKNYERNKKW